MIALLLLVGEALARAGGGEGFGGGSRSSGGGGGSYGGGGGGDGLGLLLWLVFNHPVIGVPVVIVVVVVVIAQKRNAGGGREVYRSHPAELRPARRGVDTSFLLPFDANFSLPLFLDLARLVYVRAHEERGRRNWDALRPFVTPGVITSLEKRGPVREVREVIIGSAGLSGASLEGDAALLTVQFQANYTEVAADGTQQWLVHERWSFRRTAATSSPGPDRMRALACPNCGNPSETRADGSCTRCDTVINDGRLQWQVTAASLTDRSPLPRIALGPGSGVEAGTRLPTRTAADLGVQMRRFTARHADFQWPDFRSRAEESFRRVQAAWSARDAQALRPLETDFLYQQHRYWLERYAREGLRNHVDDVRVTEVVPVKLTLDAWLEAFTVRIYASVLDWTEDKSGKVVGGSRDGARQFSEYWTFIRSTGSTSNATDLDHCPSCGAPLDRVSETGVCGYCEAKVTGGDFDWVLATIDQDEAYSG